MLEEEIRTIENHRCELDEIITDLYELKPLLEKCGDDTILKGYDECDTIGLSISEWYIRTKPVLKNLTAWLSMYYEQKIELSQKTNDLKHKIKKLRHEVLTSFNKS